MATHQIRVTINGQEHEGTVDSRLLLVHWIREDLSLTGTHIGCDTTHCGACTILLDGLPIKSCTLLAVQADGREIRTVEGLEENGAVAVAVGSSSSAPFRTKFRCRFRPWNSNLVRSLPVSEVQRTHAREP